MSQRSMLSKYAPPGEYDFYFEEIRRRRPPDNQPIKMRMHLPVSLQCHTCGNIMYNGTRINSRKECCSGEMYSGTQIFSFWLKCNRCSAEITLKTDPRNSDYTVESGATRHVKPCCEEDEINESCEIVLNPTFSPTRVLNPTDVLTKTNGLGSSSKAGNKHSTFSATVNPCKKQKTELTAGLDNCEETVAEENIITTMK